MTLKNRWLWVGLGVLAVLLGLSLFAAPQSSQLQQGSSFSRAPSGYGAWYAYMEQQKLPIQRWQRPLSELFEAKPPAVKEVVLSTSASIQPVQNRPTLPITLLQVNPTVGWMGSVNQDWLNQGNVLVLLGQRAPVTDAPFRSVLPSPAGAVKIETRRRHPARRDPNAPVEPRPFEADSPVQPLLADAYGLVVWQQEVGKGKVIYASTPHLAANAYQDEPGNFKFLAQLLSEPGHPIYVDEYLHGYRDREALVKEGSETLLSYLAKTPLLLLAIQAIVILLVLVWGQNQRLGPVQKLEEPAPENSAAYIEALSGVLQKANSSDFVVETIGKAEQATIQRALGLGNSPVDSDTLVTAWTQQTGRPASDLQDFLKPLRQSQKLSHSELLTWLEKVRTIRRQLP